MREEGAKGQWRELLRVREVDRAWAREGFRRSELSKLETALKSTPVLQLERGEVGGRRSREDVDCASWRSVSSANHGKERLRWVIRT
jgi:hypothetical protein